jgi:Ca-activated chloride channel family protein
LLPNIVHRAPGKVRFLPLVLLLLALGAMIVGVARPHATVSVPREEATVILAMDVSRSMKATDVEPTRLEAARAAAKVFLAEVPEKFRVGVVSFATRAAVGVPPTEDRALVETALDSLIPGEGTAIGDAVALSIQLGQRQRSIDDVVPPRAILLISDGARDGGRVDPAKAAEEARSRKIPVYTVLVGTPDGVVEETLTGGFRRIIRVPPSPETLEQLAAATGGEFFVALDDEGLRKVYEDLGSRLGEREELREVTDVFAAGAAVLLLFGGGISAFLFRRVA